MLMGVNDAGDGQVNQRTLGVIEHVARDALGHAPGDEAAAPHLAAHQALALKLLVGVGHGLHADGQTVGDLALRRQALAIAQVALLDVTGDGLDQ
ncbi:hypothetical protein D9M71_248260 [compost metagenome]